MHRNGEHRENSMDANMDQNDMSANVDLNEGNPNVELHRTDPNVDLKDIERKVWMRCHQDGLMDIFLGLMLLLMGSGFIFVDVYGMGTTGALVAMAIMGTVATAAFYAAKRLITYPRIGRVEFGPKGRSRLKKTAIVFSASVIVGIAAFVVAMITYSGGLGGLNAAVLLPVIYILNMVVVFGLWAWFFELPRFYLVGVLYALPLPLIIGFDEMAGIRIGYLSFAIPGTIILLMGLVILIRFLRRYPPLQEGY